ncbi:MAG: pyrimidine 5'-nucleotidase [Anaerolineae bacterium]
MTDKPRFRFLLCDLDNTLYPPNSGVMQAVGRLIVRYISDRLDVPPDDAEGQKRRSNRQYGTTMRGLILYHGIDPEDYLGFVHNLPLEQYIQPNPDLDAMLDCIPLRKVVSTNADREHAERVLDVLGIRHHFERIIDVRDFGFNSKPHQNAYRRILEILNASAEECILVDDAIQNLAPAQAMGMVTVLVGAGSPPVESSQDGADICIADILDLADAICPWLMS